MSQSKPSLLPSILKYKCPSCRKGSMYTQKSILPLGHMLDMPEHCEVCDQKMEIEPGFYYGTGYVSYALSVGIFFINAVWYAFVFGLSYKDNSVFKFLGVSIAIVILLQPWLMRISRVLYLYMFVKYGASMKDNAVEKK